MAEYTELPGNRRFKQKPDISPRSCAQHLIAWGSPCELPGEFDTPTKYRGQWAYLCRKHVLEHTFRDISIGFHLMGVPRDIENKVVTSRNKRG